jgi:streptogramin lyase
MGIGRSRTPLNGIPRSLKLRGAAFLVIGVLATLTLTQAGHATSAVAHLSISGDGNTLQFLDSYTLVTHVVPTNDSGPWSIAVDPTGIVWFLEEAANQLGSYNPSTGAFKEYPIPTPSSTPIAVAADREGDVWFTELSSNQLAELPSGASQIVEHPIPGTRVSIGGSYETLDCGPGAVLPGSTGTIFVACLFSNQIDEYFPSNGTFAGYDLTVFHSGPAGLLLDGKGNLWFTAADADMLGKAVVSNLKNGTSDGITEFAPVNQTYPFESSEETSFLGGTTLVESSLPTPSGIAMAPDGKLWVTEHIDNSFDSYDPSTGSLDRYWTSQTFGAYEFDVSFPNGIAVDKNGTVWIAEHYGNRIGEFDPSSGLLTEYPSSNSTYDGDYELTLDNSGNVWFVEIQGNAIGELVQTHDLTPISVTLQQSASLPGRGGSLMVPITFNESRSATQSTSLALELSGVSSTGEVTNMTAQFSPADLSLSPGGSSSTSLDLATLHLAPGVYYLTLTAKASPRDVLYSVILTLTVTGGSPTLTLSVLVASSAVIVAVGSYAYWRRSKSRGVRRRGR